MTTIAYRHGVMVADTRAYIGSGAPLGEKCKIRRLDDGTLIGCSTRDVGVSGIVLDWFSEDMPGGAQGLKDRLALTYEVGFAFLAVSPDGTATYINGHGQPTRAKAEFYAIGSGDDLALGAMAQGASAQEAVAIACRFDPYSAPPFTIITHGG